MRKQMSLTSFISGLVALLAAFYGITYEDANAQIAAALQSGKTNGDRQDIVWLADPGNVYNDVFDNTGLPNIPSSWGGTSYVFSVGSTSGLVLRGRTGLNNRTGIISRISWYIASMGMADGEFLSLNVVKPKAATQFYDGATPIIAYMDLYYTGGALKVRIRYPTNSGEVISTWSGSINPGTVFQTYLEVNLITDKLIGRVNGEEFLNYSMDPTLLQTSMQTVDTLVIGSSGGSTGRNTVFLADAILEHIIPNQGVAPSNSRILSPVNGATNQEITVPLTCAADNGPTGFEIRVETANPPVGAWNVASGGIYNPTSLSNGTTYYSQCRTTNQYGISAISAVSSFTTITPASTTTSDPLGIVTAGRQTTWSNMRTDYLADTTCQSYALDSNSRMACEWYDLGIKAANDTVSNFDGGITAAWLSNVPGESRAAWCTKSYNTSVSKGFLKYTNGANVQVNERREFAIDWLIQLDLCYGVGGWTQTQSDLFMTRLNEMATNISTIIGTSGWRCSDVDQPIAEYFFLTAYYKGFQNINPTIKTLWETTRAAQIGGTTPTTLNCTLGNVGNTGRNIVARLYGTDWQGGASTEGSMYGLTVPMLGMQGCEALRALAPEVCTEIDTYTDDSARFFPNMWFSDYKGYFQDGDNQEPHRRAMPRFSIDNVSHIIMLTGVLPDGSDRQNLYRWYKNFRATNGSARSLPNAVGGPGRSLMWGNPYATASTDLSTLPKCYTNNAGYYIYNDSRATDAAQLWYKYFPDGNLGLDHTQEKFSDFQMWHKNEYAITHLLGYGANDVLPEGSNAFYVEGLPMFTRSFIFPGQQYRKVNGFVCLSNGIYVAGTSGGLLHGPASSFGGTSYYDPPPKAVDEFTQSHVGLVSADKKYTITFNMTRIRATDPETLPKFARYLRGNGTPECNYLVTCWRSHNYMSAEQQHIQDYPRWTAFMQQGTDTLPTVDGGARTTSWFSLTGYNVKDFWLSPTTVNIDLHRVDSKIEFGFTTDGGDSIPYNVEKKYRTVIESSIADVEWNPIQRAVVAYDLGESAPIFTVLSATGGCGATLMKWGTNNNVVFIYNITQGAAIPQSFPTIAQATTALSTVRFANAETCTVPWTATTSTTQILVMDRLPSLAWTSNLNGAGAVALAEDASGFKELSATGIQAHSIVIIGS